MKLFKKNKSKSVDSNPIDDRNNPYKTILRDVTENEYQDILLVKQYTMTSEERLVTLSRSISYLVENNIEGDIVECGVWKGGSMMMIAKCLSNMNSFDKQLFLFDTYEGMTEPDENDISWNSMKAEETYLKNIEENNKWCYSTLEEVKSNLEKISYPVEKMFFIKGKVEDTIPYPSINKISLLRLDTDWYISTKHELENLYDKIVPGGILIIDDYGHWEGAKKAVDEFIRERKLKVFLNRIDYTARLIVKPF